MSLRYPQQLVHSGVSPEAPARGTGRPQSWPGPPRGNPERGLGLLEELRTASRGRGLLIELVPTDGHGAWAAAAAASNWLGGADRDRVGVVVIGRGERLRAARPWFDAGRMLWVTPASPRDSLWALERCLRCTGVAVTVGSLPAAADTVAARRLTLAAESGGGIGLLVRPGAASRDPCWSDVRLEIAPAGEPDGGAADSPRPRWLVRLTRRRGTFIRDDWNRGRIWELTDDGRLAESDPPRTVPVPAGLVRSAVPAGRPRSGGRRAA